MTAPMQHTSGWGPFALPWERARRKKSLERAETLMRESLAIRPQEPQAPATSSTGNLTLNDLQKLNDQARTQLQAIADRARALQHARTVMEQDTSGARVVAVFLDAPTKDIPRMREKPRSGQFEKSKFGVGQKIYQLGDDGTTLESSSDRRGVDSSR